MGRRAETGRVGGDDSADTADSGDTGETADSAAECVAVQGGGCGALAGETRLVCGDDTGGGDDSAPARVQGSSCGAFGSGPALALLLVAALRRGPWSTTCELPLATHESRRGRPRSAAGETGGGV